MSFVENIKQKLAINNAVIKIVLLNVIIYVVFASAKMLFWLFKSEGIIETVEHVFVLYPSLDTFITRPWGIVTYMFFHTGFFHLLFNMLWLYWLGNLLQEYLGNKRVYQAFFLGGVFGGLIYLFSYNVFPVFESDLNVSYALGASAGVLSVVVAAASLLPHYAVLLFGVFSVQLRYIAIFLVLIDLVNISSSNSGGRIAHLGGALTGFLFIKYLYTNNAFTNTIHGFLSKLKNPIKTKKQVKVHYKNENFNPKAKVSATKSKPNQADIDAVLDKISKSGYESLSAAEKEILFKASQD